MNKFQIIEEAIERGTGRIVDGKAVWEEIERAVGRYEGEDGRVIVDGEDSQKEKWGYWIELKRTYDKDHDQWETEIKLLEILILNKESQKEESIKIPWEEKSMTKEEFYENTRSYILGVLPGKYSGWEVDIRDCKNQEGFYKGMIFKPTEKSSQPLVLPVFNLDTLYDRYGRMELMDGLISMAEEIEYVLVRNDMSDMGVEEFLKDIYSYDNIKKNLYVSVMSVARQQDMKDALYLMRGDIPLQARILLKEIDVFDGITTSSIEVNEKLLEIWNLPFEQVMEDALNNTERLMPTKIMHIGDSLRELMSDEMYEEAMDGRTAPAMYVVTNNGNNHGAANLFLPGMMEKIAEQLGDSYFVLPSSVHETLVIPAETHAGIEEVEELKEIVAQTNKMQLPLKEQLSYNVYFYDADTKIFSNAEDAIARRADQPQPSEGKEKATDAVQDDIPHTMI